MNPPLEADKKLLQTHNVFEDIIAGKSEASIIYRDEHVIAFLDIQPINAGHVLVMPITQARFLNELDESIAAHLFIVAQKVSKAIRHSGLRCTGINMFLADGASAGQEVPHLHLHVFPRFEDDEFGFTFAQQYFDSLPERAKLDTTASQIRRAFPDGV